MRLLVLGGTQFVGRAMVVTALERGHTVTTFNRGVTVADVPGVDAIRGDRYSPGAIVDLAGAGPWDAVLDASGYVPANVLAVAEGLRSSVGRYVFASTLSVYAGWPVYPLTDDSPVLQCPPDAGPDFGEDVEDGPTRYGYQKSGCEAAVQMVFGERATALRAGVILGPREHVGRLPWWLRRVRRGGPMVAPGSPGRGIQPVDVRDVALFAVLAAEGGLGGSFNLTAPIDGVSFGELLAACVDVTGGPAEVVWVPDGLLLEMGVRQWSELPLWRVSDGVWRVDSARAKAAGFVCRPLATTVADTWDWLMADGGSSDNERAREVGLDDAKERRILAAVRR